MTKNVDRSQHFEALRDKLLELARRLEAGAFGEAAPWGGGGAMVGPPKRKPHDWRDRYVSTKHVGALSWMFCEQRDLFSEHGLVDYSNKTDFYGRLANAAIRCVKERDAKLQICAAVLHEAFVIAGELRNGTFEAITVAVDGEIADDHETDRIGFLNLSASEAFFRELGIHLPLS